jgi:hypothetical protein
LPRPRQLGAVGQLALTRLCAFEDVAPISDPRLNDPRPDVMAPVHRRSDGTVLRSDEISQRFNGASIAADQWSRAAPIPGCLRAAGTG